MPYWLLHPYNPAPDDPMLNVIVRADTQHDARIRAKRLDQSPQASRWADATQTSCRDFFAAPDGTGEEEHGHAIY